MRRRAAVDANQSAIIAAMRQAGASVQPLHAVGKGWACKTCGIEKRPTAHQMRKTYCSKTCMAEDYKTRMAGDANPNFGGRSAACAHCGMQFQNDSGSRKYCSAGCYWAAKGRRATVPCLVCGTAFKKMNERHRHCSQTCSGASRVKPKVSGPGRKPASTVTCGHCGGTFKAAKSAGRKFCSYVCFLDSGGSKRAGEASIVARKKYGAKKDANHQEVFQVIGLFTAVKDLSGAGFGVPDGLAWAGGGWQLFDVKNPKTGYGKRGLNPIQRRWADDWRGGPVYLIYSVEEAMRFAKGDFGGLKRFPDDA